MPENETLNMKLHKCYEIMGKEIEHCPKGFDCLYEDWMFPEGQKKDCAKCWENYINRLIEKDK